MHLYALCIQDIYLSLACTHGSLADVTKALTLRSQLSIPPCLYTLNILLSYYSSLHFSTPSSSHKSTPPSSQDGSYILQLCMQLLDEWEVSTITA